MPEINIRLDEAINAIPDTEVPIPSKEGLSVSRSLSPDAKPTVPTAPTAPSLGLPTDAKDRPEWLPGKFKTPQDLAKAYAELEGKLGKTAPKEPVAEKAGEKAGDKAAEQSIEKAAEALGVPVSDFTVDALKKYSDEFTKEGNLSEDSYAELAKKGVSKDVINTIIQGQIARQQVALNSIYAQVGGEDTFKQMVQWASVSLSPEEREAYNKAVNSEDSQQIDFAVKGLHARYKQTQAPKLMQGSQGTNMGGFRSRAEVQRAMADPRYETDKAYREDVMLRLANRSYK